MTSATKLSDHTVSPDQSISAPKRYGPPMAAPFPTPSTIPNALARSRVGKSSDVYG